MEDKENNKSVLSQEEYEYYLNWVRDTVLDILDDLEEDIEKGIHPKFGDSYIPIWETLINLILLVSDTDKGKKIYIQLLEYAKHKHPELANEYWELFDDRDNLYKRRYFNLKINASLKNY